MRNQLILCISTLLVSLVAMQKAVASSDDQNQKIATSSYKNNVFYDIKIRQLNKGETSESLQCHRKVVDEFKWQAISFAELPQNQHFCFRASINIEQTTLMAEPVLLTGMLASVQFYWDGELLTTNGKVGDSRRKESPGLISTLVHIPDSGLSPGIHLLSAEMSTFHIGKELKSIGYILGVFDEQKLSSLVLTISMISALFLGVLLILSIIFQLVYWLYQRNLSFQLFSFFCFISTILLATEQAKFWLNYSYDWHVFRLSLIYALTFLVSFLLPVFYIQQYQLPRKKDWVFVILVSLLVLSIVNQDYDITSSLLFGGSLIWALTINLYQLKKERSGKVSSMVIFLGLTFVVLVPKYFNEVGFGFIFICLVMLMLVTLIKEMRNHKDQSLQAVRVRTEQLRRNMQPHFLMNCLTQLMELIEIKPKDAIVLISALSDEFRQLTKQSDQGCVVLIDEIELCNKHLKIMSLRYQQEYKLNVTGKIENVNVPASILHSQIENCFTHNRISSDRPFELLIEQVKDKIHLTLKTPIEKKVNHKGTGSGERYIKAKLAEVSLNKSSFTSYQEQKCWLSKFTYPNIEQG